MLSKPFVLMGSMEMRCGTYHAPHWSQLLYASPAWWGYLKADERNRLQAVIKKAIRYGYLPRSFNTLDELSEDSYDGRSISLHYIYESWVTVSACWLWGQFDFSHCRRQRPIKVSTAVKPWQLTTSLNEDGFRENTLQCRGSLTVYSSFASWLLNWRIHTSTQNFLMLNGYKISKSSLRLSALQSTSNGNAALFTYCK